MIGYTGGERAEKGVGRSTCFFAYATVCIPRHRLADRTMAVTRLPHSYAPALLSGTRLNFSMPRGRSAFCGEATTEFFVQSRSPDETKVFCAQRSDYGSVQVIPSNTRIPSCRKQKAGGLQMCLWSCRFCCQLFSTSECEPPAGRNARPATQKEKGKPRAKRDKIQTTKKVQSTRGALLP
ncbi:unnamed protein product [Ectocarpus sp. 4 AP-2014]